MNSTSLDPVHLHATCDLLDHPVAYKGGGFAPDTDLTARLVLRAVVAWYDVEQLTFPMPGDQRPVEKTQKARAIEGATFEALAGLLVDHPDSPLGNTVDEVRAKIAEAYGEVIR